MTKVTDKKRKNFILALSESGSVLHAAKTVGISRQHLYRLKNADSEFAQQWDEAAELGTNLLEDECVRRAFEGIKRNIYYQGKKIGIVTEYSDNLLMFLLKGRRPEKYRDRNYSENTASDGGNLPSAVVILPHNGRD